MQILGDVTADVGDFQPSSAKSDMAIRAHEIERGPRNFIARQFGIVDGILWDLVHAQQATEIERTFGRRRLPDDEQVELRVVELLEQILDGAVRLKPEPQPREAIASARRIVWQTLQRFR